jgi:hypothetical protein
MAALPRLSDWPGPEYVIRQVFRAPVDFVYRWCTDFTPDDARLEGESYARKILHRDPRRVLYEDLEDGRDGWFWARYDVRLLGDGRWEMVSWGNRRLSRASYRLRPGPSGTSSLELRLRRRPSLVPSAKVSRRAREAILSAAWKRFARALERDYRESRRRRPRR